MIIHELRVYTTDEASCGFESREIKIDRKESKKNKKKVQIETDVHLENDVGYIIEKSESSLDPIEKSPGYYV